MNNTRLLRDIGQSLWLDNITRELLDNGTLRQYVDDYAITGLTSNPTIFDEAIGGTNAYDASIRRGARAARSDEALFFELALDDLRRAADLFRPAFAATDGVDGWASIELSPTRACAEVRKPFQSRRERGECEAARSERRDSTQTYSETRARKQQSTRTAQLTMKRLSADRPRSRRWLSSARRSAAAQSCSSRVR